MKLQPLLISTIDISTWFSPWKFTNHIQPPTIRAWGAPPHHSQVDEALLPDNGGTTKRRAALWRFEETRGPRDGGGWGLGGEGLVNELGVLGEVIMVDYNGCNLWLDDNYQP